jgi:geranylgeranyl reductase family protein
LDKEAHPRYKVCGGGLSARIEQILDPGFHAVVEQTVRGVQFTYQGQNPCCIESSMPIAYLVMRDRFDHLLLQQARQAGTVIHEHEPVVRITQDDEFVSVTSEQGTYRARALIGADGANSMVAQHLFPKWNLRRMPTLESEIPLNRAWAYPQQGRVVIDLGSASMGYGWVFPKENQLSVGVAEFRGRMASPRGVFQRFVEADKGLSGLTIPQPLGHPLPLYAVAGAQGPRPLVQGRALLVGDAAHLVDPLFGEGIYYAVRSGQLAAQCIVDPTLGQGFSAYERMVCEEIYGEFQVASRMARILYTFPKLCHQLLHRYHDVIGLYYEVLQGRETYQSFFFKARGLVKTSFRELLGNAIPRPA